MKKLIFAAFALTSLFFIACTKEPLPENGNQILIRFQNSTGAAIEEAQMELDGVDMTEVGPIASGATTDYIVFDAFEVGFYPGDPYKFPMGTMKGKKDGVAFSAWSGNWCGTGVEYKQLEPGEYTLEVLEAGENNFEIYQLRFVE